MKSLIVKGVLVGHSGNVSAYHVMVHRLVTLRGPRLLLAVDELGFGVAHYAAARGENALLWLVRALGGR
jgi:hypothetical protein